MAQSIACTAALACAISAATGVAAAADAPGRVQQLGWLAGCWQLERRTERGPRIVDEQWMAPSGGALLGSSRTVSAGVLVDFEHMLIREEGGGLVFTARPARQPEASFRAIEIADGAVVFENREHDFPQRVIYRRGADGRLDARIEGVLGGQPRAIDFPYRRVACPG
ncbi:DUF6265 family protein [Caldimonas sp. KR1-144]|uniref:DUF6265 family protein n=1 Tax=Caldimonas sp. KR1-144 TaxID=3400911 RepID=UPI003C08D665